MTMLTLTRKESEIILIHPSEDLDPTMTVAELFSAGPIKVIVAETNQSDVQIGIDLPGSLCVIPAEQFIPGNCTS
jgi:sRNA-binding carbon storage regulator CsrA